MKIAFRTREPTREALETLRHIDPTGVELLTREQQTRMAATRASNAEAMRLAEEKRLPQERARQQKIADRFAKRDCIDDVLTVLLPIGEKHGAARHRVRELLNQLTLVHQRTLLDDPARWSQLRDIGEQAAALQAAYAGVNPRDSQIEPTASRFNCRNDYGSGAMLGAACLVGANASFAVGTQRNDFGKRAVLLTFGAGWSLGLGGFLSLRSPQGDASRENVSGWGIGLAFTGHAADCDAVDGFGAGGGYTWNANYRVHVSIPKPRDTAWARYTLGITYSPEMLSADTRALRRRSDINAAIDRCKVSSSGETAKSDKTNTHMMAPKI